jgi:ABC-type branched-subunit amino acid transport system permease subunit
MFKKCLVIAASRLESVLLEAFACLVSWPSGRDGLVLLSVVTQAFTLIIFILCAGGDVPPSSDVD